MRGARSDQRGQTSVIIIGFAFVVLLLVVVVIDVGAAYLKRQSLDSLADGGALYGADAAAEGRDVYRGGVRRHRPERRRRPAAVHAYLRAGGAHDANTPASESLSRSATTGSSSTSPLPSTCRSPSRQP